MKNEQEIVFCLGKNFNIKYKLKIKIWLETKFRMCLKRDEKIFASIS